jgi:hypothetical protein
MKTLREKGMEVPSDDEGAFESEDEMVGRQFKDKIKVIRKSFETSSPHEASLNASRNF